MEQSLQQIYEANSGRKYPFIDTHTEDVADDIVLDMSLSVPSTVTPRVTVISVTTSYFFMALEDTNSGEAIGHCIINKPAIGRIYNMEITMDDAFGWIVLGPGRSREYENRELDLELDPTVVITQPITPNFFNDLEVDGFSYTDLIGKLTLTAASSYIKITKEVRDISGVGERTCLVFSRDDAEVPASIIYGGLLESGQSVDNLPATKIGGIQPDESYNVEITSDNIDIAQINRAGESDDPLGLLFNAELDACQIRDPRNIFTHGQCDEGIDTPLPLDGVVEELNPEYALEDCGCIESSSSVSESESSSSEST
jgi:hypothetical protein